MLIDLPPPLWVPSRPAIIRAFPDLRCPSIPILCSGAAAAASLYGGGTKTPPSIAWRSHASASSASVAINFASTAVAGQLLGVFAGFSRADRTTTTPSGYTQLFLTTAGSGNSGTRLAFYYKVAAGGETSVTISSSPSSDSLAGTAFAVNGYSGTPENASATGNSAAPQGAALNPSWGSTNNLFLTAFSTSTGQTLSSTPSGYGNTTSDGVSGTDGILVAMADKTAVAGSETPPAWAISASGQWAATTIAIKPA